MKNVLLIDDNEDAIILQTAILESDGFRVESAMNGLEGLEKLKTVHPDIIVSDVLMPEMDGFQFCRAVKNDESLKDIPLVFYSAQYTDEEDKTLAEEVGAEGFIYKPMEMEKFLAIINRILEQNKNRTHLFENISPPVEFEQKHYEAQAKMLDKKLHELEEQHRKLKESEENYRRLIEGLSTDYIIFRHDKDGRYTYVSPTVTALLGYNVDEYMIHYSQCFTPNPINKEAKRLTELALSSGVVQPPYEIEVYTKNGATRFLLISEHPLKDSEGSVTGMEGIAHDITEQKLSAKMEEETREQLHIALIDMIRAVALTIEKRDPYTSGHQQRVAEIAVRITEEMGWEEIRIEGIRLGALIHDIGKIAVPIEILSKPGKLMDIEFSLIKVHPQSGYDILKEINFPWPIAQMIYQHHERLDGSGYPHALFGEQIIMEARVLAVADVVEAISSHRPYRRALGIGVAIQEMEANKGRFYDSEIADICIRLLRNDKKIIELLSDTLNEK
jgi:PAS domain S-box-containing protein/putative nucleotidyltransferase with HDIG domain